MAIQKEIESILENNTWQVVDQLSTGKRPINAMWIFKAKSSPNGKTEKLKARIVAKGNEQTKGIDYLKTFALVVRWTMIHRVVIHDERGRKPVV
jgi:hypothetical protein